MDHTSQTQASPSAIDSASSLAIAPAEEQSDAAHPSDVRGRSHDRRAAPDSPAGYPGKKSDAIEFRVLRAGAPVRRLRLTGNRYTFGSAEGCSIRLSDDALRPMHAVLIRDAHRILVRAYSVPVEVNGNRTTETTMQVGDVLRMGAYRFELLTVTPNPKSNFSAAPFASPAPSVLETARPRPSQPYTSSTHATSAAARELPASEDVVWRERLRREVDQWRARQVECDRRETRCDDRETNLRGRESELWARAEHLYRRESQLQSQEAAAMQIHEEYAHKQQELISLREETHKRQRAFERREDEFRALEQQYHQQEIAYRKQVEDASRQLKQSQKQAESATDAVHRMRAQFVSLNQQISELSTQQQELQHEDDGQRAEQQRLRDELEAARDQAIDAKAQSDVLREQAEARVEEMAAQLDALQAGQSIDLETHKARVEESEALAEQLRQQVSELQKSVAEAREESVQLRLDYEGACDSVRSLEQLVSQSVERGDQDRESWSAEAEQLRQTVEQLSVDLARANGELSDLREANESLTAGLDDMRRQRDELRVDADSRPTSEAWQSLSEELASANQQLAAMKQEYDATLARLEADQQSRQLAEEKAAADQQLALSLAAAAMADEADMMEGSCQADEPLVVDDPAVQQPTQEIEDDSDDAEAWPSYHSQSHQDGSVDPQPHSPEIDASQAGDAPSALIAENHEDAVVEPPESSLEDAARNDDQHASSLWNVDEAEPNAEANDVVDETSDVAEDVSDVAEEVSEVAEDVSDVAEEVSEVAEDSHDVVDESGDVVDESGSPWAADADEQSVEHTSPWNGEPDSELQEEPTPLPSPDNEWSSSESIWDSQPLAADLPQVTPSDDDASVDPLAESEWPDSQQETPPSESVWQSEASDVDESVDVTSPWAAAEDLEPEDDSPWESTSQPYEPTEPYQQELSDATQSESDEMLDGDESPAGGSLASMLIQDLDSDAKSQQEEDGTYLMDEGGTNSWDQEYPEEAIPSSWKNESDGHRTESFDENGLYGNEPDNDSYQQAENFASEDPSTEGDFYEVQPEAEQAGLESDQSADVAGETVAAEEDADDDSIEAYMNRLLRRAHSDPVDSSQPETVTLSTATKSMPVSDTVSVGDGDSQQVEAEDAPYDPETPLVPRSEAPENSNLRAMRELANESARSAISRSTRVQSRDIQIQGMTKFAFASVALGCGVACFLCIPGMMRFLAVAMTIVVAGVCVYEGMQLFSEAKRRLGAEHTPTPVSDEPETEPESSPEPSLDGRLDDLINARTDKNVS